jgi:hypothetical protein
MKEMVSIDKESYEKFMMYEKIFPLTSEAAELIVKTLKMKISKLEEENASLVERNKVLESQLGGMRT